MVAEIVDANIAAQVDGMLNGANPYNFRTGGAGFGTSRPRLNNSGTLMSDAEVLEVASGDCYAWWGEGSGPPNVKDIVIGSPQPKGYGPTKNLTSVGALEHYYQFLAQDFLKERLAKRPDFAGGSVNITIYHAEDIVTEWKEKFETAFAA